MSTSTNTKRNSLKDLARKRRQNRLPRGFEHIEDVDIDNATDQYVVPWTKSANNVNSCVMLVGQDWNSVGSLRQAEGESHQIATGQSRSFQTNRTVRRLLREYLGLRFCDTYATDMVPYLKAGAAGAPVSSSALVHCAEEFTVEEVKIVRPRIVVCLGRDVFETLLDAFHYTGHILSSNDFDSGVDIQIANGIVPRVFGTHHPSYYSRAKKATREKLITTEWGSIQKYYHEKCSRVSDFIPSDSNQPCPLLSFKIKGKNHSCDDSCDSFGKLL